MFPAVIEALRHFECDSERLTNRLQQFKPLLVGLVAVKRRPDRRGEVEHRTGHLQFGLFKPRRGHTLAQWDVEDVEKIHAPRLNSTFGWPPRAGNGPRRRRPGCVSSPACTRSACATPRSAYSAWSFRLFSRATWIASSTVSVSAKSPRTSCGHLRVELGAEIPDHPFPTAGFDRRTDVHETGLLVKGRAAGHQHEQQTHIASFGVHSPFPTTHARLWGCIGLSWALPSRLHLLDVDDGLLLRVDGKADRVAGLDPPSSDAGSTRYPIVMASMKPGISLWSTTIWLLFGTTAMTFPSPTTVG